MSVNANVLQFSLPTPVDLHTIDRGQRFSPVSMPFVVLAPMSVEGVDAHDGNSRWGVVVDVADEARGFVHGQLVKLARNEPVYRVAQMQLATYVRVAR